MGPLEGTRVVEVANYVSGPFASMMLADLGADVVKVEPPGGDPFRKFGRPATAISAAWATVNRGKRNVVLDLKADAQPLLDLVRDADVFVANWRPDVADRLGIGDDVLAATNPRLVRCWITGVGPTGPKAKDPAFDTIAQAMSGMTDAISPDGTPELIAGYPADKMTAMLAVQAILAALVARERTGAGDRLDVALLDAAAYVDFADLFANRVFVDRQPEQARDPFSTSQRPLPASDGSFVIAAVTGRQIKNAAHAVGHPEFVDELFAQPDSPSLLDAIRRLFTPVTTKQTVAHWIEQFRAHDVPASPCLTIDEHLADEQVAHNELYAIEEWPEVGRVRSVRHPAVSSTFGRLRAGPAPVVLDEP